MRMRCHSLALLRPSVSPTAWANKLADKLIPSKASPASTAALLPKSQHSGADHTEDAKRKFKEDTTNNSQMF